MRCLNCNKFYNWNKSRTTENKQCCSHCGALTFIEKVKELDSWATPDNFDEWTKSNSISNKRFAEIIQIAKEFQIILLEDMHTIMAYEASQKGAYNTPDLIENTELILPESARTKLNKNTISEISESGKCLVFDVPTASGFHILRAVEMVMHEYYLVICKPKDSNKLDNWGAYLSAMKSITKPIVEETIAILQQIKDNDRNLIMHPERILSLDDAFTLFEISKTAIIVMASQLKGLSLKEKRA